MSLPHVHQPEGEVPPAAALHRLDPDHGKRLQQARVFQRAGINWLETELTNEIHHLPLPASNVAGYGEFGAKNRPDGWNTWVTFVISPAAPTPSAPPRRAMLAK